MYKNADVDVEIEFDDVMEYITDHASDSEISSIRKEIGEIFAEESDTGLDGSYIQQEKFTLLELAAKKYTLEELEQLLGNKFDLM
ncbi:hypothetical protein UFOVP1247_178 [uncultured Caudovirales phage]|uniref:Uncharacterized protein n=1 Tax=uncultured Caudovirales phage TaxID=2100421 RepID=A0A6J5PU75_9CAUD|nr:hypothetical protein UFOVP970_218 [uncultured Caudovirales phage]CAB4193807.1 hypothetical protein UFOVP1247_178 [uncultured Caudovirales phage]